MKISPEKNDIFNMIDIFNIIDILIFLVQNIDFWYTLESSRRGAHIRKIGTPVYQSFIIYTWSLMGYILLKIALLTVLKRTDFRILSTPSWHESMRN